MVPQIKMNITLSPTTWQPYLTALEDIVIEEIEQLATTSDIEPETSYRLVESML